MKRQIYKVDVFARNIGRTAKQAAYNRCCL